MTLTEYEKEAALLIGLVTVALILFGVGWHYCVREFREMDKIMRDLEENRGGSLD